MQILLTESLVILRELNAMRKGRRHGGWGYGGELILYGGAYPLPKYDNLGN